MELVDSRQELIAEILRELDDMGFVIVGKMSHIQVSEGVVCVHPINKDFIALEVDQRLKNKGV